MSLLKLAHQHIKNAVQSGDSVIDATVGNGHDTLFLAEQVGLTGRIYGFDIQLSAIHATCVRLQNKREAVTLIHANHAEMALHIPVSEQGKIKACMFNLGYLPNGDKSIITQTDSTLPALTIACRLLAPLGIMTILAYPGHAGGDLETASVENWCKQLNTEQFTINTVFSSIPSPSAPRLFVIQKRM